MYMKMCHMQLFTSYTHENVTKYSKLVSFLGSSLKLFACNAFQFHDCDGHNGEYYDYFDD